MRPFIMRLIISGLVLLGTVQALYWPLLQKPGTVLEWWQVGFLAKLGLVVGAPVLIAIAQSPLSGVLQTSLGWVLAFIWSGVVYFVVGAVVSTLNQRFHRAA